MWQENPDWETEVTFRTTLCLESGTFETLNFFLKLPPSSLRQKVQLVSVDFPFKEIPERWSTIFKFEITYEEFESPGKNLIINSIQNIQIISDPHCISQDIKLRDLPEIWDDKPFVRDYLLPAELVESHAAEISKLTHQLVNDSLLFWEAITELAKWVTLHIIYVDELKTSSYQGALSTLQTRKAICTDFVHLFLAMTRVANIPSRGIIGLAKQRRPGRWDSHSWAEVYDPQYGWTPVDMVVQPPRLGSLGLYYIRRSAGFNCLDRLYAFYPEPSQENIPINLVVNQQVFLDGQSVEIRFQKE